MPHVAKQTVAIATAFSFIFANVAPSLAQPLSRADIEACQAKDEGAFRAAIAAVTGDAFRKGMGDFDYAGAVSDAWRREGMDAVIDQRVDVAVAEVRDETSWGGLIQSLAYNKKAQELATAVTERVYRSDAMKAALEKLAGGIGKDVAVRIEQTSAKASEPVLTCLRAYLGPRYGTAVAAAVSADAAGDFTLDASKGAASVSTGDVLSESAGGITGAVILLVRRQLAGMAGRIGARLVGSVLSRLVSVVAGGVGLVLIAKDLWDLRHGVLPTIANEMKSAETKEKVRAELATTLREEINAHVGEIGAKAADHVVEIWREFRRAHAKALEIAESNEAFRSFLDGLTPAVIPRLDEVVSVIMGSEGEGAILTRLADGTLDTAVNKLPDAGMQIARETRSIGTALQWWAVAGDGLGKVAELAVHQRSKPEAFDKASLARTLAIDDRTAVARLASVSRETRDALFELDDRDLEKLAGQLSEGELETLARYLANLDRPARERVLVAVSGEPRKMRLLSSAVVRNAILMSRDQAAAVGVALREDGLFSPMSAMDDVQAVYDGRVSPLLLWEKHPVLIVAAGVLALILFLMLWRLLFPSRRRYA